MVTDTHGLREPAFALDLVFEAVAHTLGARPTGIEQRATKPPRYVYEASMPGAPAVIIKIEHDTGGDDAIVLEAWAMEQARAHGVPAPRVITLDVSGKIIPGRYAIFSRVPGRPMAEPAVHYPLGDLHDSERRLLAEAGHALRPLHNIVVAGYGRLDDDLYLRTGEVRGVARRWRDATLQPALAALPSLAAAGAITAAEARDLRRLLDEREELFDDPPSPRLLHGDFDSTHMFVDGDPPHVSGIIDFGDREAGDPLWDLATFALWEDDARLAALVDGYAPDAATARRIERVVPASRGTTSGCRGGRG